MPLSRIPIREEITAEIARQDFSAEGTGEREVLRFLAAPTDVNWGGKVHGGIVMEWIDTAAYLCSARYAGQDTVAVFSGGIRNPAAVIGVLAADRHRAGNVELRPADAT